MEPRFPKLTQILFALSKEEREEFQDFAGLPRFRLSEKCQLWLKGFLAGDPTWDGNDPQSPDSPPPLHQQRNWARDILRVLRQYVVMIHADPEGYEFRVLYRRISAIQQWDIHQRAEASTLEKHLKKEHQRDHYFHYFGWMFAEQRLIEEKEQKRKDFAKWMEKALEHNEAAYQENRLRLLLEQLNRSRLYADEAAELLPREEVARLRQHASAGVRVYAGIYQMLTEPELAEAAYQAVAEEVKQKGRNWHDDLLAPLVRYLMNYCVGRLHTGEAGFAREYLTWIGWMQKKDLLLERKQLSYRTFHNAIQAALVVEDVKAGRAFLKRFVPFLPEHIRETSKAIAQAKFLLLQKKFHEVKQELKQIELPRDPAIFLLDWHRLQVKASLELGEEEVVPYRIEAFRAHIRRKTLLPEAQKHQLAAFLKACALLNQGPALPQTKWRKLEGELLPQSPISDQTWLRRMIQRRKGA